jgi:hypothetical protein
MEALIKSRASESRLKPILQNQWVAGADLAVNGINQRFPNSSFHGTRRDEEPRRAPEFGR